MQQPIEQVLKMVADGRLTPTQGASMITELTARATPEPRRPAPSRAPERRGFWGALGFSTSHTAGVYASELVDNDLSMSSVDIGHGEGQVFRDNRLSMSSMARVALVRSAMTANTLVLSSVMDMQLEDASFTGCDLQKCSVESLTLDGGHIEDVTCSASSLEKLSATSQGRLRKLRVIGSHLKGLSLEEGAVWGASEIVGVQLNDVRLRAAALEGVDLQSAQLADVEVSRSRLDGTIVRSLRLKKVRLVDCVWSDVLMSGGDSLKRSGLEDVLFENCKLNRALLSECRLTRVTLRDVDLSEVKVHRVDLADQVIEGNKAFLEASGVHRAA